MFAYIKGILVQATPVKVIVDVGGIGYQIFIPTSTFSKLPQIQKEIQLNTSFVIRENSQALYGFISLQDRDVFEALLNVSGIGPKTALSVIGHLSLEDLHRAISHNEITTISKVPGIGKKTAEKLIIEMRDKLSTLFPSDFADYAINLSSDPRTQAISDAMNAMINLGYNQQTAEKAIKKTLKNIPEDIDLSLLITGALKNV